MSLPTVRSNREYKCVSWLNHAEWKLSVRISIHGLDRISDLFERYFRGSQLGEHRCDSEKKSVVNGFPTRHDVLVLQ